MPIVVGTDTYVTVAEASAYLNQSVRARDVWSDLSTAQKEAALVTAQRAMERLTWKGSKTNEAQALAWPRTGVTDRYGRTLDSGVVPPAIKYGQIEWAFDLSQDSALESVQNFASNDRRYRAGPVEIEFWRPERPLLTPRLAMGWFGDLLLGYSLDAVTYGSGSSDSYPSFFGVDDFARAGAFS